MSNTYSPDTLEHIATNDPAEWMGRAPTDAPAYNPKTHTCFFRNGAWDVAVIVPAAAAVPQSVTMRQARLALLAAELLPNVTTAINALASPQKEAAQIEWEYSQTVERTRGFVLLLGAALGLTNEQLDDLFRQAATL